MALEYNTSLYPPLGYTFKEVDGTKFRGTSWVDLEAKVRVYREQHGKPAGDVSGDILSQICKASPSYCRQTTPGPKKPSPRDVRPDGPRPLAHPGLVGSGNIMARVSKWLNRLLDLKRKGQLAFVPTPEARRRASICAACPRQVAVTSSCGGCQTTLKFVKNQILAGQAPVDKTILSCSALGEDAGVSIHLVQAASGDGSLPAPCWRRQG